ncbi:hypothetical protein HMPREF9446_00636 [Bacteroides fluxus YIT 12057]|uniref:Uncharacterized protein n=1 Tax=Bacteroides fluxus YIT 12057 TaxID=763034 RepID=F3PPP0_9BACE|nr:hypothetical protein HMPREF9446_00636 [Bacteroides fluxus YIT 12057]
MMLSTGTTVSWVSAQEERKHKELTNIPKKKDLQFIVFAF